MIFLCLKNECATFVVLLVLDICDSFWRLFGECGAVIASVRKMAKSVGAGVGRCYTVTPFVQPDKHGRFAPYEHR